MTRATEIPPPDYVARLVYRSRFVRSSVGLSSGRKWNFASRFVRLVEYKLILALNESCFVDKATFNVSPYRCFMYALALKCRICSFTELVLLQEFVPLSVACMNFTTNLCSKMKGHNRKVYSSLLGPITSTKLSNVIKKQACRIVLILLLAARMRFRQ